MRDSEDRMTPPPSKGCPVPGCSYKTPAHELAHKEMHTKFGHPAPGSDSSTSRAEKLPRPELKEGTDSDYIFFNDAWERYKDKCVWVCGPVLGLLFTGAQQMRVRQRGN